ncbi:MAG: hypothetical protein V4638_10645 [Bacteroidota bacterium]
MSKDNFDNNMDDFFEGKMTEQQEKELRDSANHPYFLALKSEKEITMDWSFDNFMNVAEKPVNSVKKEANYKQLFYWSAAAIFILTLGTYFFISQENGVAMRYVKKNEAIDLKKEEAKDRVLPELNDEQLKKQNTIAAVHKVARKKIIKETPLPVETTYNPEFVVINGKPIYDLQEAKEATLNSLHLLASNVEKSVSNMENVKHLSINF